MQINKIRNEKGEMTTDTVEIQRIIRSYYESLYATKLENVQEMDWFLDKYRLPKLNQDQVNNLNRPVSREELEAVIKNLPTKKNPRARWFQCRILPELSRRADTYTP